MSSETDSSKTGLKTVISELHDPAAPLPGEPNAEQLELLPLSRRLAEKNLSSSRGAGRPPGAKNKNTEAWRDYMLARYPSPLDALAQTYIVPIEELCKILSCTRLEAFKLQMAAAKELAPYLHQKQPLAIDTGDKGLIQMFIGSVQAATQASDEDAQDAVYEVLDEPQQNQLVSSEDNATSNAPTSNAQGEAADIAGENDGR